MRPPPLHLVAHPDQPAIRPDHAPSLWALALAVAIGGSVGALARFAFSLAVHGRHNPHSPWTTAATNFIGCLAVGLVLGWLTNRPELREEFRVFLTVGLLGGYTTFATYAADALKLIQNQRHAEAFAYLALSALGGLAFCAAGYAAAARLTS